VPLRREKEISIYHLHQIQILHKQRTDLEGWNGPILISSADVEVDTKAEGYASIERIHDTSDLWSLTSKWRQRVTFLRKGTAWRDLAISGRAEK
jgi:hypothetical protein